MTFLNQTILVALAALAVPVLIHLLHRRAAQPMDWGAMRFLLSSLALRSRRMLLEEMVLMAMRCGFIALLVLAAARPFVPADSPIPWAAVLPAAVGAAMAVGVSAVLWPHRRSAAALLLAGGVLLLLAVGGAAAWEKLRHGPQWAGASQARDLAIVVDGSLSMTLQDAEGSSAFARAIQSAHTAVDALRPGDAAAVVLAGPLPRASFATPISERKPVHEALGSLRPTGGPAGLPEALSLAGSLLAEGQNPAKSILLITDGQGLGWRPNERARWQFVASTFEPLPTEPRVIPRNLGLPADYENLTVAGVEFSRTVIGTDRPVGVRVRVLNSGTRPSQPVDVELSVQDSPLPSERIGRLEPGATESVEIGVRFDTPGRRVVRARLLGSDDLPGDDAAARAVDVLETMPVLVVGSDDSGVPLGQPSDFVSVALAPKDEAQDGDGGERFLMAPTRVTAGSVTGPPDLSRYRAVVLADAPRLRRDGAAAIVDFVRNGGGLLVTLGTRASPAFYNSWTAPAGLPVMPARMLERIRPQGEHARPLPDSLDHPGLGPVADPRQSDIASARFSRFWRLEPHGDDPAVSVGGTLNEGSPLLVERRLGRGRLIALPVSLGRGDGNLPTLSCYVPLLHELTCYLAEPTGARPNIEPGEQVRAELPAGDDWSRVAVLTPRGERRPAVVNATAEGRQCSFAGTDAPGLYRMVPATGPTSNEEGTGIPFVVRSDPQEGTLRPLAAAEKQRLGEYVALQEAETDAAMTALLTGDVPGSEIWKRLGALALLMLIAEVAAARWITMSRRAHAAEAVEFADQAPEPARVRERFARRGRPEPEPAEVER